MRIAGAGIRPYPDIPNTAVVRLTVIGAFGCVVRQRLVAPHVRDGLHERLVAERDANGALADLRLFLVDITSLDTPALTATQGVRTRREEVVTVFAIE